MGMAAARHGALTGLPQGEDTARPGTTTHGRSDPDLVRPMSSTQTQARSPGTQTRPGSLPALSPDLGSALHKAAWVALHTCTAEVLKKIRSLTSFGRKRSPWPGGELACNDFPPAVYFLQRGLPSREQSSNLLPRHENNARLGYKRAQRNSRHTNTGFQSPWNNATAQLNSTEIT